MSEMEPLGVLSRGDVIRSFALEESPWLLCHDRLEGGERRNGVQVTEGGGRNERESRGTHSKLEIAPPLCSASSA